VRKLIKLSEKPNLFGFFRDAAIATPHSNHGQRSRNGVRLYLFLLSFVRRLIFSYIWLRRTYFRSEMKRKTSFPFAFRSLIRNFAGQ
jgi:hypothetical protein